MKANISLLIGFLLLLSSSYAGNEEFSPKNPSLKQGPVYITSTPDLYALTSKWASEYNRINPSVKIMVTRNAGNSQASGKTGNLSFITDKSMADNEIQPDLEMVVGRDVTAPVFNAENPMINEILAQGISPEQFARIFQNPDLQHWGTLLKGQDAPMHIYLLNDASTKQNVAAFLGTTQIPVSGITFGSSEEVIAGVQNDIYAIGFCKVVNLTGAGTQGLVEKIRLLPIDKNGNGTIDYMENIYGDLNSLMRGVWIGKYPKALSTNIYAVSNEQPMNEAGLVFLSWVLTDGQQFMNQGGFCELTGSESQTQLEKINIAEISVPVSADSSSPAGLALIVLGAGILLAFALSVAVLIYISKKKVSKGESAFIPAGFDEKSLQIPNGLYFDKTHTWAFMEKNGRVTIGLDDFIQHITGPITRVGMKNPGEKILKGDLLFSVIQSGKQLNLYAPISGTIREHNETLVTDSTGINISPYAEGWVYSIEPSNWLNELPLLDIAEKYKRWVNTEFSRLKDFLATTLKPDSPEYAHVVLQDGGLLKDGVLSDFGPEIWEDFQTNFLDTGK